MQQPPPPPSSGYGVPPPSTYAGGYNQPSVMYQPATSYSSNANPLLYGSPAPQQQPPPPASYPPPSQGGGYAPIPSYNNTSPYGQSSTQPPGMASPASSTLYQQQQQQQQQPPYHQEQYQPPQPPVQQQQQQQSYAPVAHPGYRSPPTTSAPTLQQQQQQSAWRTGRLLRPPYVDPTTNIIYDVDQPEYTGWLTKQSMWLKDWRRRYFLLKGSKLFFAKNEYSAPHGMIDLAQCTTVKSADLKSKKRHSFEISTPETCYLLYADTETEKDDWIGRVGKAIVRCSRTYVQQDSEGASQHGTQNPYSGGAPGGYPSMNHNNNNNNTMARREVEEDDDDIYTNDDPDNPYFND